MRKAWLAAVLRELIVYLLNNYHTIELQSTLRSHFSSVTYSSVGTYWHLDSRVGMFSHILETLVKWWIALI